MIRPVVEHCVLSCSDCGRDIDLTAGEHAYTEMKRCILGIGHPFPHSYQKVGELWWYCNRTLLETLCEKCQAERDEEGQ